MVCEVERSWAGDGFDTTFEGAMKQKCAECETKAEPYIEVYVDSEGNVQEGAGPSLWIRTFPLCSDYCLKVWLGRNWAVSRRLQAAAWMGVLRRVKLPRPRHRGS